MSDSARATKEGEAGKSAAKGAAKSLLRARQQTMAMARTLWNELAPEPDAQPEPVSEQAAILAELRQLNRRQRVADSTESLVDEIGARPDAHNRLVSALDAALADKDAERVDAVLGAARRIQRVRPADVHLLELEAMRKNAARPIRTPEQERRIQSLKVTLGGLSAILRSHDRRVASRLSAAGVDVAPADYEVGNRRPASFDVAID
jgi:hypothetical protein